jgi:hypothetical protein
MNKTFPVLLGQHAWESNLAAGIGRHAELPTRVLTISIVEENSLCMAPRPSKDAYDPAIYLKTHRLRKESFFALKSI